MAYVGAWKNYDELEECLTLDELLELYKGAVEEEARRTNNTAKAFGAEGLELDLGLPDDNSSTDEEQQEAEDTLSSIFSRASDRVGKDIVRQKDKSQEFNQMKIGYQRIN